MDFGYAQFISSIATIGGTVGLMYTILRNFRQDFKNDINEIKLEMYARNLELHDRLDRQENRIFQLAMGKSFRDILAEEVKKESEEKYVKTMKDDLVNTLKDKNPA